MWAGNLGSLMWELLWLLGATGRLAASRRINSTFQLKKEYGDKWGKGRYGGQEHERNHGNCVLHLALVRLKVQGYKRRMLSMCINVWSKINALPLPSTDLLTLSLCTYLLQSNLPSQAHWIVQFSFLLLLLVLCYCFFSCSLLGILRHVGCGHLWNNPHNPKCTHIYSYRCHESHLHCVVFKSPLCEAGITYSKL